MLEGVLYQIVSKGENTACVRLLPDSPIYKAHFPGHPITPGVTLMQMALELMGDRKLKSAKEIKFVSPVLPGDGRIVVFNWTLNGNTSNVLISLEDGSLCTKMSLNLL